MCEISAVDDDAAAIGVVEGACGEILFDGAIGAGEAGKRVVFLIKNFGAIADVADVDRHIGGVFDGERAVVGVDDEIPPANARRGVIGCELNGIFATVTDDDIVAFGITESLNGESGAGESVIARAAVEHGIIAVVDDRIVAGAAVESGVEAAIDDDVVAVVAVDDGGVAVILDGV